MPDLRLLLDAEGEGEGHAMSSGTLAGTIAWCIGLPGDARRTLPDTLNLLVRCNLFYAPPTATNNSHPLTHRRTFMSAPNSNPSNCGGVSVACCSNRVPEVLKASFSGANVCGFTAD